MSPLACIISKPVNGAAAGAGTVKRAAWRLDPQTGGLTRVRVLSRYPPRPTTRTGFEKATMTYERLHRALLVDELIGINFVCTFFVGTPIYVPMLAVNNPFSNAFTNSFSARIIRLQRPSGTCLVFPGGRVVVVGARYEMQARWTAWRCCEILRRCGCHQSTVLDFRVRNIAFTVACGPALDLAAFHRDYQMQTEYKPDQFCGLTYYPRQDESWSFNLFSTGKMVLTGVKAAWKGMLIYNGQLPIFRQYIMETRPPTKRELRLAAAAETRAAAKRAAAADLAAGIFTTKKSRRHVKTTVREEEVVVKERGGEVEEEEEEREDLWNDEPIPDYMRDTEAVNAGMPKKRRARKQKRRFTVKGKKKAKLRIDRIGMHNHGE